MLGDWWEIDGDTCDFCGRRNFEGGLKPACSNCRESTLPKVKLDLPQKPYTTYLDGKLVPVF